MIVMNETWIFDDFDMGEYAIDKYVESRGWIYLVQDDAFQGFVKIGRTSNMYKRLLDYNADKPFPTTKVHSMSERFDDVIHVEKKILEYLYREIQPTTFRKEWFEDKYLSMIIDTIKEAEVYFLGKDQ